MADLTPDQYRTGSRELSDLIRDIEDAIDNFTVDDVGQDNLDSTAGPLGNVMEKFNAFRTELRAFYTQFDRDQHQDWETEWEGKLQAIKTKCKENERQVRAKVVELRAAVQPQHHSNS